MGPTRNEPWRATDTLYLGCEMSGRIIAECPICRSYEETVEHRRQNTAYLDDKFNWITSCWECFQENEKDWRERWDEYYQACM